jgi:hypothetical protein
MTMLATSVSSVDLRAHISVVFFPLYNLFTCLCEGLSLALTKTN